MSSMQVTRRMGNLSFSCYLKTPCVFTFCNSGSILFNGNLLLLFHDQSQSSRLLLKAFWKMVNMAPGIFGTSVDVMILLSFC